MLSLLHRDHLKKDSYFGFIDSKFTLFHIKLFQKFIIVPIESRLSLYAAEHPIFNSQLEQSILFKQQATHIAMHMMPILGLSGTVYSTCSIQCSIHLHRAVKNPDSWLGEKGKGGNKPVRATTMAGYSGTTFPSCREATAEEFSLTQKRQCLLQLFS